MEEANTGCCDQCGCSRDGQQPEQLALCALCVLCRYASTGTAPRCGAQSLSLLVHRFVLVPRTPSPSISDSDLRAAFQDLKVPAGRMERGFSQGCVVIGQGGMAAN